MKGTWSCALAWIIITVVSTALPSCGGDKSTEPEPTPGPAAAADTVLQLTTNPGTDLGPIWASDGSRIIYYSSRLDGSRGLWSVTPQGGPATEVAIPDSVSPRAGGSLTCSPDGSRIAYLDGRSLWIAPIGGGVPDRLHEFADANDLARPEWSPDGEWIACEVDILDPDQAHNDDIWLVAVDGGAATQLTFDPGYDGAPRWSPDGLRIAYDSYKDGQGYSVRTIAVGGGTPIIIDPGVDPDWAPDGRRLVYNKGGELWIASADGQQRHRLTSCPNWWGCGVPRWSPSGGWIAMLSSSHVLAIVPETGGEPISLTDHGEYYFSYDWSPDGRSIVFESQASGNWDIWLVRIKFSS